MDIDTLAFFGNKTAERELYERLLSALNAAGLAFSVRVQKTQISLYNRHMFACVSFLRVKKKAELPPTFLTVSFGLDYPKESPRIAAWVKAAPNRWTHHVVIGSAEDMDEELLSWLREAYDFSERK